MLVEEGQVVCSWAWRPTSLRKRAELERPVGKGRFTGIFQVFGIGCRLVRLITPCKTRVPSMPRACSIASAHWCVVGPMARTFVKQIAGATFDATDLLGGQVIGVGAEAAWLIS